ncbi:MAG TPA: GTP cyclohydrolase I FolE [Egibacteraceae bacterium]|nr:GTP cyclohydrolase I FolE [Actinomycetota bacterium]HWB72378.1 GTP cyclohydrolase I FolE [Egibacteraceae bacterium]
MTDSASAADVARSPVADSDARVRVTTGAVPSGSFDHDKIRQGVRLLFEGVGIDPQAPGIRATPERVARMFDEIFAGLLVDPADVLDVVFEEGHDEIVIERDVPFASMCEHHLLPFIGSAHVGYLPNERGQITGLSKLARLVDLVSRRPNLQERVTTEIADVLMKVLEPRGVIVVIEAEHLCKTMRGVRKPGAVTVTSAVRGAMREDPRTREEALMLIGMGRRR